MKIFDLLSARLRKAPPAPRASRPASSPGVDAITETIQRALASAGLDTHSGPLRGVTDTIEQALSAAGLQQGGSGAGQQRATIEGVAREVGPRSARARHAPSAPADTARTARPGEFVSRSFSNAAGARSYKLYVPASYAADASAPVPLLVMLHGCTQSPDDFAAGTRMNALADRHGFLVAYPAQAANANGSKCWNWFRAEDQLRDRGEPSLIAGITREVAADYRVDPRRIYVAGLSAGAAMAVILGETYPELYAAVGAHSGLPYAAAHDMASAFGAMKGGGHPAGVSKPPAAATAGGTPARLRVPTIVFHGDRDHTVAARNGAAIVAQASGDRPDQSPLRASVQDAAAGGRAYRRTVHADAADRPVVEQWLVHGAGHAWSGGSPDGSFTDAAGPDASAEMIRFFSAQAPAGAG